MLDYLQTLLATILTAVTARYILAKAKKTEVETKILERKERERLAKKESKQENKEDKQELEE
ncbi:MAG: hypothetical protein FWG63_07575 [Defluviitaleaceae bacterium]|nr:hypothetical protein [Defluviitaleaceae bacterium]